MTAVWTAEEFYRQRDRRTVAVLGGELRGDRRVHVDVDDMACRSAPGQALVLAMVNQLARVHRRISFSFAEPEAPVQVPMIFAGTNVREVVLDSARQIDPFGSFAESATPPADCVSIGVGLRTRGGLDWYVGAEGAIGILSRDTAPFDFRNPGTIRGAAVASCLGAAALFRTAHDLPIAPRRLSAWNYREGEEASAGPRHVAPADVGRVLLVGAGAVASGLTYWCHLLGFQGSWAIVDEDTVKLHNTNRSLVFIPAQAGWDGATIQRKADILARFLPNAESEHVWYHKARLATRSADVILALANEHDVRALVASRSAPVVLHATTGENWLSQLHRHIAGRDDCIGCRTLDVKTPELSCSTGVVPPVETEDSGDAALPFLSAAAGLMLTTAMERLAAGELDVGRENDWRWDWGSTHLMARDSIRTCRDECRWVQPHDVRHAMHSGTRWIGLDR